MKHHAKHLPHYFSLIGIFAFALLGFWIFRFDRNIQTAIAISVSAAYFSWAMVHHSIHKDLTLGIVLEYLSVSILGLVIILSLILQT